MERKILMMVEKKCQNCLPGVPSILRSMIDNVEKYLTKGNIIFNKSINVHTVESSISRELKNIQKKYIDKVEIGSYPFFRLGKIGVSIVLRSSNQKKLKLCLFEIKKMIKIKKIKIYKY